MTPTPSLLHPCSDFNICPGMLMARGFGAPHIRITESHDAYPQFVARLAPDRP